MKKIIIVCIVLLVLLLLMLIFRLLITPNIEGFSVKELVEIWPFFLSDEPLCYHHHSS